MTNEDEDIIKSKESPVSGGTSYMGGGVGAGSQGTMPMNSQPKSQQAGTGFINMQNWLNGSSGGQMAGAISDKADTLGKQATTDIGNLANEAQSNITAGTPVFNQDLANSWLSGVSTNADALAAIKAGGTVPAVGFNQTSPAAAYSGVAGADALGSYMPAVDSSRAAAEYTKNSQTESGVGQQLSDLYGGNGYTQGMNVLDQAVARSGEGANKLAATQNKWGGISGYLDSTNSGINNAISGAQAQAKTVSDQWGAAQKAATDRAASTNAFYGRAYKDAAIKPVEHPSAQKTKDVPVVSGPRTITGGTTTTTPGARVARNPDPEATSINYNLDPTHGYFDPTSTEFSGIGPNLTAASLLETKRQKMQDKATGVPMDTGDYAAPGFNNLSKWMQNPRF